MRGASDGDNTAGGAGDRSLNVTLQSLHCYDSKSHYTRSLKLTTIIVLSALMGILDFRTFTILNTIGHFI